MSKPNVYGATIVRTERLTHPHSLVWHSVTYDTPAGSPGGARGAMRTTTKTLPGGDVNRLIENALPRGSVDVILNGRSQIIAIIKHEES